MRLFLHPGGSANFGDRLNLTMWQHLLPQGYFDGKDGELFLGIGSLLADRFPQTVRKVVAGSGYAATTPPPATRDGSWEVLFVRGPRTAQALGLDPRLAIGDAALLLRETPLAPPSPGLKAAFIPRIDSLARGNWAEACRLAGVDFVSPTGAVDDVVSAIRGARVVVCEALYGAVVADALRTPWVAVRPITPAHRFKWFDWAEALGLGLRPHVLPPSSLREAWSAATGFPGSGAICRGVFDHAVAAPGNRLAAHLAARALQRMISAEPQLSGDAEIELATERALAALDRHLRRGRGRRPVGSHVR